MRNTKLAWLIVLCFCIPELTWGQDDNIKSILEAAEQGDAEAQYFIGRMYYLGQEEMPKDYTEAAK